MKLVRTTNGISWCSSFAASPCRFRGLRSWGATFLVLVVMRLEGPLTSAADTAVRFHVGFSQSTLGDVPNNDVTAALGVWTTTLLGGVPFPVQTSTAIHPDPKVLHDLYWKGQLDGVSVGAEEFLALDTHPEFVYAIQRNGSLRSRYLLLTRQDTPTTLEEALVNKGIQCHQASATCLVPAWIESLRAELPAPGRHRGRAGLEQVQGASKAILRVFFKQAEVCVATEGAFSVAVELNPQIASKIRVLARSPEFIPSAFFMHPSLHPDLRAAVEKTIHELDGSTRGKQVLTVFQGERLLKIPLAEWQPTLDILRGWQSRKLEVASPVGQGTGSPVPAEGGRP